MKNKILKLKKWICKKFGHSFDSVDFAMLEIMQKVAINKKDFAGETIICKRCKVPCSFTEGIVWHYLNGDMYKIKTKDF